MFKKIIYSFMALSLTMLPATEVMAVPGPTGGEIANGETYTLNSNTGWTSGQIVNNGGVLTIQGYTQDAFANTANYIQNSVTSTLANYGLSIIKGTDGGKLTIQGYNSGGTSYLSEIKGGTVDIGETTTGNELVLGEYSSVSNAAVVMVREGNTLTVNDTNATLELGTNDTWGGHVELTNGTINVNGGITTAGTGDNYGTYTQTGGELKITNSASLDFAGNDQKQQNISGGTVTIGDSTTSGTLNLGQGAAIYSGATVNIGSKGTVNLTGQRSADTPSMVLNTGDTWDGTITNKGTGYLELQGYTKDASAGVTTAKYQQSGGSTLELTNGSTYWIRPNTVSDNTYTTDSYISAGTVDIRSGSTLNVNANTTGSSTSGTNLGATLDADAVVKLENNTTLGVNGTGTAVLNDFGKDFTTSTGRDNWQGQVVVSSDSTSATDNPILVLQNVGIDFTTGKTKNETPADTTAVFVQNGGTTRVTANANGGSDITINNVYGVDSTGKYYNSPDATGAEDGGYHNGAMRVGKLTTADTTTDESSLTINYLPGYTNDNFYSYFKGQIPQEEIVGSVKPSLSMTGNGNLVINTNGNEVDFLYSPTSSLYQYIEGYNANNTLTVNGASDGSGRLVLVDDTADGILLGSNVVVNNGSMDVIADKVKIGVYADDRADDDVTQNYGDLTLVNSTYTTYAPENVIVGNLTLSDSWYNHANVGTTTVGGNLTTGSGMNLMNGGYDKINVGGKTTITDGGLELKIDVNPTTLQTDNIHSLNGVLENGVLNLSDYNISTTDLRKDFYRFNVITTDGAYERGAGANKIVTGNARRIIRTKIADYQMFPSSANGAYDMMIVGWNPQVFRGQVALDVLYANQQVINNQLYDRMMYSILPYFNAKCANKTASADTLYSPYQYSMTDPGIWFKPYANFETIHMNYGLGKVRNNAYGAMIGADFKKAEWGNWTFIPTAYIGYNGGRTTYNGVGMWHNGGQLGLMGTLTNGDFVTMLNLYGGGYHNSMHVGGAHDKNALWNAGVGSKTAYNIHLPWDFILQPTLYMSYNYVGGSRWNSSYDGFRHKLDALNAFSVAPGVNLIWQKETFSIYALFQAMFNVGSTVSGRVAEINLPHVGIRDPYFEYGLGASKYFLDRFSGYGQVTARSGARKGVGFQLGLNIRI